MSRRVIVASASLASVVLALLPPLLAAWLAYRDAFADAALRVEHRADALARTVSAVLAEVADGLERLDRLPLACTRAVVQRLRELAFDVPEISETGLMRPDGTLICSSWGVVDPPESFDLEPIDGRLALKGPVTARMLGRLVLVAEHRRPDGGVANALIQPRSLVGLAAAGLDAGSSFVALFDRAGGRPFVAVGLVPPIDADASVDASEATFADAIPRLTAVREVTGFPHLVVVAAIARSAVSHAAWPDLLVALAAASILSGVLVAAVVLFARSRLSLRAELVRAIRDRRLRVQYQPVIDVRAGRCIGVEALARWHDDERGNIRPDLFVPLAERVGLLDDVTRLLLERVMADLVPILREDPTFHVAINVGPDQLRGDVLVHLVDELVLRAPIELSQVVIECSERTFLPADGQEAPSALRSLTGRGLGVALDDFGAGYASLAHLEDVPFAYIKIDRHFVAALGASGAAAPLLDAVIAIAARLGVPLMAEGVETEDQLRQLAERGITRIQGFYYARPLSLKQLRQFLAEFRNAWRRSQRAGEPFVEPFEGAP